MKSYTKIKFETGEIAELIYESEDYLIIKRNNEEIILRKSLPITTYKILKDGNKNESNNRSLSGDNSI